jgi:hypothetical protein
LLPAQRAAIEAVTVLFKLCETTADSLVKTYGGRGLDYIANELLQTVCPHVPLDRLVHFARTCRGCAPEDWHPHAIPLLFENITQMAATIVLHGRHYAGWLSSDIRALAATLPYYIEGLSEAHAAARLAENEDTYPEVGTAPVKCARALAFALFVCNDGDLLRKFSEQGDPPPPSPRRSHEDDDGGRGGGGHGGGGHGGGAAAAYGKAARGGGAATSPAKQTPADKKARKAREKVVAAKQEEARTDAEKVRLGLIRDNAKHAMDTAEADEVAQKLAVGAAQDAVNAHTGSANKKRPLDKRLEDAEKALKADTQTHADAVVTHKGAEEAYAVATTIRQDAVSARIKAEEEAAAADAEAHAALATK